MCTYVSGPLVRAFQFHSQTLVGPLLSVWSDLTGTDDFRESSTRYAVLSDGSCISLGQKRKGKRKYQPYRYIAPCKVIWIPQSGRSLLAESKITGNICLWNPQSGILGFKIRNPAQEIQNPANDWNPEYKFCWQGIWNSVPGIRNRQCGIQNSRLYWITWHGASYDITHGLKHIISNCNQFLFCF